MKWGSKWGGLWGAGTPAEVTAWSALAKSRVLYQHPRGEPHRLVSLAGIVGTLAGENLVAVNSVIQAFALDSASGAMLDVIGRVLLTPREGASDDQYRVALAVSALYLVSSQSADSAWTGTCESVIAICRTLAPTAGTITLSNTPPYAFTLDVPGVSDPEIKQIMRAVCRGLWAGVLGMASFGLDSLVYGSSHGPVANEAIYGSSHGTVVGAAVYGHVITTGTGESPCV